MKMNDKKPMIDGRTGEIFCPICGAREKMELPIKLDSLVEVVDSFEKRHKGCL